MSNKRNIDDLVMESTNNYTKIVSTDEIQNNYPELYWGGNGLGDRFANKKYNYSSIKIIKKKAEPTLYSENVDDQIPEEIMNAFLEKNKGIKSQGIIGIFVHSKKINNETRPIRKDIHTVITSLSCVQCGTHSTVCDHKNDLYNDPRVLNIKTQLLSDFQPLCNHCNLQKRQICKNEKKANKENYKGKIEEEDDDDEGQEDEDKKVSKGSMYSAKKIPMYKVFPFEFPWEKKAFNIEDIYCKNGTYWFDPVEFNNNIFRYSLYVIPILNAIKHMIKTKKLKVLD